MNEFEGLKRWKCKHDHVLGVVRFDADKNRTWLLLFRQAIDVTVLQDVDVIAVVDTAIDVRCSICDATRTWGWGRRRYNVERLGLVVDGK
jgi:hypothetical protein